MELIRVAQNDIATYGVLINGLTPFAVTLERPWRNNRVGESCIPPGPGGDSSTYQCRRVLSPKFGVTFEVMEVPGRSAILFHKGNIDDDSHGCILIGESFNPVLGKPGISESGHGFEEFLALLKMTDRFPLVVREAFSTIGYQRGGS